MQLRQFWETEEVSIRIPLTEEEQSEDHFLKIHTRNSSGRYIVRLLFKTGPPIDIGELRSFALCLFRHEMSQNERNSDEYNTFLHKYIHLAPVQ